MVRLFISQPMRGKSDEEIVAEREHAKLAASRVLKDEVEVLLLKNNLEKRCRKW